MQSLVLTQQGTESGDRIWGNNNGLYIVLIPGYYHGSVSLTESQATIHRRLVGSIPTWVEKMGCLKKSCILSPDLSEGCKDEKIVIGL